MPRNDADEFAGMVRAELERDAKEIASRLWGSRPPGAEKMSEAEYLAYLHGHWADRNFRHKLVLAVGPANFLKTYAALVGLPPKTVLEWPIPLASDSGGASASQAETGVPGGIANG